MYCIFNEKSVSGNNNGKRGTKCIRTAFGALQVKSIDNSTIGTNYVNYNIRKKYKNYIEKNIKIYTNNNKKNNIKFGRVVSRIEAKKHCLQSVKIQSPKKYKNIFNCLRGKYNNTIKKILRLKK